MAFRWQLRWICTLLVLRALLLVYSYPSGGTRRDLLDMLDGDTLDEDNDELGDDHDLFGEPELTRAVLGGPTTETPTPTTSVPTPTLTTPTPTSKGFPTAVPALLSKPTESITTTIGTTAPSAPSETAFPYSAAAAASTPPGEATEWKVIGLVVICIAFAGTLVLSILFFDSWWGFVCAVVCGRRARKKGEEGGGEGKEEMVPDWEKRRSWEFRLASEEGHRYPSMGSLEKIVGVGRARREERARVEGIPVRAVRDESMASMVSTATTNPGEIFCGGEENTNTNKNAAAYPELALPQLSYSGNCERQNTVKGWPT